MLDSFLGSDHESCSIRPLEPARKNHISRNGVLNLSEGNNTPCVVSLVPLAALSLSVGIADTLVFPSRSILLRVSRAKTPAWQFPRRPIVWLAWTRLGRDALFSIRPRVELAEHRPSYR